MNDFTDKRFKKLAGLLKESSEDQLSEQPDRLASNWFHPDEEKIVAAKRVFAAVQELLESLEDAFTGPLSREDAAKLKGWLAKTGNQIDMIDDLIDATAEEVGH